VTLVVNALNVEFTPMQISLTQYARMILAVIEKFLTQQENAKSALSTPSQTLLARSAQVIFVSQAQIKSFYQVVIAATVLIILPQVLTERHA